MSILLNDWAMLPVSLGSQPDVLPAFWSSADRYQWEWIAAGQTVAHAALAAPEADALQHATRLCQWHTTTHSWLCGTGHAQSIPVAHLV